MLQLVVALFAVRLVASERSSEIVHLEQQVIQLRDQSKWLEAMPLAEGLVELTVQHHGENSTNTADAIHLWAWLAQQNGEAEKAERLWWRALDIDEKLFGKNTLETTRRLHLLANFYRDQADYEKAESLLRRTLAIREQYLGPEHPQTALVLESVGNLFLWKGDFASAEMPVRRAVQIYEKAGRYHKRTLASGLSTLGWIYILTGDLDQAEAIVRRTLELKKHVYGTEHVSFAYSLRDLATIQRSRRNFEQAAQFLEQSVEIVSRVLGTNHVSLPELLGELGTIYVMNDNTGKAESVLEQCHAIVERNFGPEHPRLASSLMALSELHEKKGQYEKAKELCAQALRIRESRLGDSHPETLGSLRRVALFEAQLGGRERVLDWADRIQCGEEAVLRNVFSFTSERQRLAHQKYGRQLKHSYDLWANLGAAKPLARSVLRTKGVVLDSLLEDNLLARDTDDPDTRELIAKISQARRQFAQAMPLAEDVQQGGRKKIDSIARQIDDLQAALARRVSGIGRSRRALAVEVDQVQSAIPKNAALLEFIRYRHYAGYGRWKESYGALILSHEGEPRWVSLGPTDAIERSMKLYQHTVRSGGESEPLVAELRELHERVWVPLSRMLPPQVKKIIVSPDGELNFVSFATLLGPSERLLGEDYLFSYVSSGRDLLAERSNRRTNSLLAVWANPDFGFAVASETKCSEGARTRELRGLEFRPLPGAEKEGRLLWKQAANLGFHNAVLHLGREATEAELYRTHSPKALHFATHGFILRQSPADRVMEEDLFERLLREPGFVRLNPMLRSGLALAGAQRTLQLWAEGKTVPSDDDGIVTADEIASLDLRGTSLVVLSACDTGGGEAHAGEGVLGLRRAFIQAGAQHLLLTLWPIEDGKTVEMMAAFYTAMNRGNQPAFALARVQQVWLKKLRAELGIAEACRAAGPFIMSFQGRINSN